MIRKEICSLQIIVVLVALTGSLFLLSADALPLTRRTLPPHILTAIAGERWLPAIEESWITFHLATPEKGSIREQYLNQEVLAELVLHGAGQPPSSRLCKWRMRRGDVFGDFSIGAGHASLARRLECLRGVVDHLLWQTISEDDFRSTPKDEGYWALYGWPTYRVAAILALLLLCLMTGRISILLNATFRFATARRKPCWMSSGNRASSGRYNLILVPTNIMSCSNETFGEPGSLISSGRGNLPQPP
jgi:hypothetical protein